jgi:hypothetical protein
VVQVTTSAPRRAKAAGRRYEEKLAFPAIQIWFWLLVLVESVELPVNDRVKQV